MEANALSMTRDAVARLTEERFSTSTYAYANDVSAEPVVREAFLADARRRFAAASTAPTPVAVVITDFHAPVLQRDPGQQAVWQVLREGDAVVFLDEREKTFGKATLVQIGERIEMLDLGLRGSDPFEVFLA